MCNDLLATLFFFFFRPPLNVFKQVMFRREEVSTA